jgi:hypothetical protein
MEVNRLPTPADPSEIAKNFPGTPLNTLKRRYHRKKAVTMEWTPETVEPL